MNTAYLIIATVIGITIAWLYHYGRYLPEPYRSRPCQGRAWKTSFPNKSKHEIRDFLVIFSNAFALRKNQKLLINPHDGILDLYKTIYTNNRLGIDNLELETFASDLKKKYKLDLRSVWSEEITFGCLFENCQAV
jgi:hypothetical protein